MNASSCHFVSVSSRDTHGEPLLVLHGMIHNPYADFVIPEESEVVIRWLNLPNTGDTKATFDRERTAVIPGYSTIGS